MKSNEKLYKVKRKLIKGIFKIERSNIIRAEELNAEQIVEGNLKKAHSRS